MRIALFTGTFPSVSETFILRQITGLLDLGHDVDIFAESRPPEGAPVHADVDRYRLLSRVTYLSLPPELEMELPVWPVTAVTWMPESGEPVRNARRVLAALPAAAQSLRAAPALAWKAVRRAEFGYQAASLSTLHRLALLGSRRRRYDVIHAHFGPIANNFRFARELFGAPMVVSFHGYDATSWPRNAGPGCYDRLWDTVDLVTVNSTFTGRLVRGLGCPGEKLRQLPVGIRILECPFRERSLAPGRPVRFLTVARLVEQKGHEYALRGLAQVRRDHAAFHYTIVGDGPKRAALAALICELDLEGHVTLAGARTEEEVRRLMHESDVFLLSPATPPEGDTEGQGLVLQEAQACGMPVLATRHGAIPEGVLDGVSAVLVPEGDPESLARAALELIRDFNRWPEMGRRGREFVSSRYDQRDLTLRLNDLYEGLRRTPAHTAERRR